MKVLLAAGGSAGHVEPALTLADSLRERDPEVEIIALGTSTGIEASLVPERGYHFRPVPAFPWPRRPNLQALGAPGRILGSIRAVREALRDEAPDVVVGFGGYVAFPAYAAARSLRIPIVVHEANSRPGLADRVGARLTPWVATNVDGVLPHATHIGMPLRHSIRDLAAQSAEERQLTRETARQRLGLASDRPTLLAFGGSLGAKRINVAMAEAQGDLAEAGIQVLHLVGNGGHGLPESWPPMRGADDPAYVAMPYLTAMHEAFAAADAVVCRAGAMTCAELAALGLPAAYVPLPVGNGEQALNAAPIIDRDGGILIDDADFDGAAIRDQVIPLIVDVPKRRQMGNQARVQAVIDADERLVDMVLAAARLAPIRRTRKGER